MMGWRGALRSIGSAVREAERNAKRRQCELAANQKHFARMEAAEQAAHEVEVYENAIDVLKSVHKDCGETIDWVANGRLPEPKAPNRKDKAQKAAREKVAQYRPSFFDRLFKRESKRRAALNEAFTAAIERDETEYQSARAKYDEEHSDWSQLVQLSRRIVAGESEAMLDAIKQLDPFSEIKTLGSEMSITGHDGVPLHVVVRVHGKEIIPREAKCLLQSGKLSVKQVPAGRFNELHQDYVCGCVLRLAREVFALLPVNTVIVSAKDEVLDARTGHLVDSPLLSVLFVRKTLAALNMDSIDPSDSMQNFVHVMNFKKTAGFQAVSALKPEAYRVAQTANE